MRARKLLTTGRGLPPLQTISALASERVHARFVGKGAPDDGCRLGKEEGVGQLSLPNDRFSAGSQMGNRTRPSHTPAHPLSLQPKPNHLFAPASHCSTSDLNALLPVFRVAHSPLVPGSPESLLTQSLLRPFPGLRTPFSPDRIHHPPDVLAGVIPVHHLNRSREMLLHQIPYPVRSIPIATTSSAWVNPRQYPSGSAKSA